MKETVFFLRKNKKHGSCLLYFLILTVVTLPYFGSVNAATVTVRPHDPTIIPEPTAEDTGNNLGIRNHLEFDVILRADSDEEHDRFDGCYVEGFFSVTEITATESEDYSVFLPDNMREAFSIPFFAPGEDYTEAFYGGEISALQDNITEPNEELSIEFNLTSTICTGREGQEIDDAQLMTLSQEFRQNIAQNNLIATIADSTPSGEGDTPTPRPSPEPSPTPTDEPNPSPEHTEYIGKAAIPQTQKTVITQSEDIAALTLLNTTNRTRTITRQIQRTRTSSNVFDTSDLSVRIEGVKLHSSMFKAKNDEKPENYASAGDAGELNRRWGTFMSGSIDIGSREDSNGTKFDFDTSTLIVGGDYKVTDSIILGGALGKLTTNADNGNEFLLSQTDMDQFSYTLFASFYSPSNYYLDLVATSGMSDFTMRRGLGDENGSGAASAETDGNELEIAISSGYTFSHKNMNLRLSGFVSFLDSTIDAYEEETTSSYSTASVNEIDIGSVYSNIAMDFNWIVNTKSAVFIPQFSLGWEKHHENETTEVSGTFGEGIDIEAGIFSYEAELTDTDYLTYQVGFSSIFKGGITTFLTYDSFIDRESISSNNITFGLRAEL